MTKKTKCSICQIELVEGYCPYHDTFYMMLMINKKIERLEDELIDSRKIIKQLSDQWKDWINRVSKLDIYDGERWDHPMNNTWVSNACKDSFDILENDRIKKNG